MTAATGPREGRESPLPVPAGSITKVATDLDFERDGKQISELRIPFTRNTSAWGRVLVPIVQLKNGTGPTLLITGGVHGDEYEGPVILGKLIQRLEPERINGRIIIVPALNLPAHQAATRLSPLDQKDLNRSFPGERNGSITSVLAHYVDRILLPRADVVIDIHSGGTSLDFVPCVVMHELASESQMQATFEAMLAFGAPYGLILKELDADGMLDTAAESKGKIFLSTELRGAGSVSPFAVQVGDNGLCNLLEHFGVADAGRSSYTSYACTRTQKLLTIPDESCFHAAPENSLYEPLKELGEEVNAGETIGQLHFIANLNRAPRPITASRAGTLICRRVQGRVETGDCIAVIGVPCSGDRFA